MTDAEPVFIDTNVLVFASESRSPLHQAAVTALDGLRATGTSMWISRQVVREYMAVKSRPQTWARPQPGTLIVADTDRFQAAFSIAEDGPAVTEVLSRLVEAGLAAGKQVHDANIVATMRVHGIGRLLTNNVADFARFAPLITVEPL